MDRDYWIRKLDRLVLHLIWFFATVVIFLIIAILLERGVL